MSGPSASPSPGLRVAGTGPDAPLPPTALGPLPAVPTLVLEGMADLRTPVEQARLVAAAIPGARLAPFTDCAHAPFVSRPEDFLAAARSFLHD